MKQGIASILIAALLLSACATTTPSPKAGAPAKPSNIKEWMARQSRAKKKAIVGALLGGAAGFVTASLSGMSNDEVLKRTVAGAIAGAIAGFAVGKHQDQIFAGRDLAVRQNGYVSSQGYIARVESVSFDPPNPKPGTMAKLSVRYVVLGPDPNEAITIQMFRGLKYGDDYIFGAGPNEFVIPRGGGIVDSTMELTVPQKAPVGTYSIEALLEDSQGRFPQAIGTGALYIVARAQQHGGVVTAAR
jgi:outer membrane lipoprotein SlyB